MRRVSVRPRVCCQHRRMCRRPPSGVAALVGDLPVVSQPRMLTRSTCRPEARNHCARASGLQQPDPLPQHRHSPGAKVYDYSDETLHYEGPPHRGDLAVNIALGATLIWLPLTFAAFGRCLFVNYRFTNRRISVISNPPWGKCEWGSTPPGHPLRVVVECCGCAACTRAPGDRWPPTRTNLSTHDAPWFPVVGVSMRPQGSSC